MSGASGSSTGFMASAKEGVTSVTRESVMAEDMISSTPKGSPSKVMIRKLTLKVYLLLVTFRLVCQLP